MVPPRLARDVRLLKYEQVAAGIRAQVADGTLTPGAPAPSSLALSRATGYSVLTCRRALRDLIKAGVLVPGASPNARPRVASPTPLPTERARASAARALSAALAARRRAAGLTQPQLAEIVGMSVTTVGHAETGRLWQSRRFWEQADKWLSADGELLALHDAYRAASTPADSAAVTEVADADPAVSLAPAAAMAIGGPVTCVTITWADGTVTTVYPPETPARPADATPDSRPRGLPRRCANLAGRSSLLVRGDKSRWYLYRDLIGQQSSGRANDEF
jgi:DNA-binding transcriptional regulator YhcF (GntR family)